MNTPPTIRSIIDSIKGLSVREELLGGQHTSYVQKDSVIGWLEELEKLIPSTPNSSLPPLVPEGPRREMLVRISVSADFEKRLDNQWEVEREIQAARWSWDWAPARHFHPDLETNAEVLEDLRKGEECDRKAGLPPSATE